MEQGESPSPPLTPSRRSVSLRGSPVEKKAFLHPNRSRQRSPSVLSGSSSEQQPAKSEEPVSPVAKRFSDTRNWCFAAIALLLICSILLSMVIIMGAQVSKLSDLAKEQTRQIHLEILVLTETLRKLQTGHDQTCSMCRIKWVQQAEHCFLFSHKRRAWQWSNTFCAEEFSSLAMPHTQQEMDFLLRETNKSFDTPYGQFQYQKFWIGLKYDPVVQSWIWTNGTPSALQLHPELGRKGCVYLQNGKVSSQDCSEEARFICKAKVQFGWS